jgi:hypothetical protein
MMSFGGTPFWGCCRYECDTQACHPLTKAGICLVGHVGCKQRGVLYLLLRRSTQLGNLATGEYR